MVPEEDGREANINVVDGDRQIPVLGELNERTILIEEVWEAMNEICKGSRSISICNGLFKERCYGSVIIVSETVQHKF